MPRFLVLALDAPLWAVAVVFAAGGCGAGFLNPILGAVSFERVPREMLGRVRSLSGALAWAGIPFGGLAAGAAVGAAGLGATLTGAGVAHGALVGVGGLRKEWAEMERGGGRRAEPPCATRPRSRYSSPASMSARHSRTARSRGSSSDA
ncbi:hypothetical protein GCM10020221_19690 [Streptomyces thioluteus]|uniref:MFS transporter n=1 Tax=Streptomyces thioluteus TaxID=66431 RepID=A0ABN3WPE8_STRTU